MVWTSCEVMSRRTLRLACQAWDGSWIQVVRGRQRQSLNSCPPLKKFCRFDMSYTSDIWAGMLTTFILWVILIKDASGLQSTASKAKQFIQWQRNFTVMTLAAPHISRRFAAFILHLILINNPSGPVPTAWKAKQFNFPRKFCQFMVWATHRPYEQACVTTFILWVILIKDVSGLQSTASKAMQLDVTERKFCLLNMRDVCAGAFYCIRLVSDVCQASQVVKGRQRQG